MSSEFYFDQENFFTSAPKTCNHTTTDLITIRNCSIWFLNIIWRCNKYCENHIIYGKNESVNNTNSGNYNSLLLTQNIQSALPIDFSLAQQFVYEKNIEKIKFSIKYDIEDYDCPIKFLNKEYSNYNFEIYINANIHNIPMLKENINFIVKGYDILKTIQNKLVEIKSQKLCNNYSNSETNYHSNSIEENEFKTSNTNSNKNELTNNQNVNGLYNPKAVYAKIFSNMNFSFAIEFSMENFMLDVSSINFTNIAQSNITINKIFIEYYVPLCVLLPRNTEKVPKFNNNNKYPNYNHLMEKNACNQFNTKNNFNQQNYFYNYNHNNNRISSNYAKYSNYNQNTNNQNYFNNNNFNKNYNYSNSLKNINYNSPITGFNNNHFNINQIRNQNENLFSKGNIVDKRFGYYNNNNFKIFNGKNINNYGGQVNNEFFSQNQNKLIRQIPNNTLNNNSEKNFYNNISNNNKANKMFNNKFLNPDGQENPNSELDFNSTSKESTDINPNNKSIPNKLINKNNTNFDFALKVDKTVDFIPKNFLNSQSINKINNQQNPLKINNNTNNNKNKNDSANAQNQSNNQLVQDNASMNSSMISLGTTTSLISSIEDEDFITHNIRGNYNNNSNINVNFDPNSNCKFHFNNSNFLENFSKINTNNPNNIDNQASHSLNTKSNPQFNQNENNVNSDFLYFSNFQNNFKNLYYPIIVSPQTCNININLNPQIYGNILIGNNQDFANYYLNNNLNQESNILDDDFCLNANPNNNDIINNKINNNNNDDPLDSRKTNKRDNYLNSNQHSDKILLFSIENQSQITPPSIIKRGKNYLNKYSNNSIQAERMRKVKNNFTKNRNDDFNNKFSLITQSAQQQISCNLADEAGIFPLRQINKHNFCNWFSFMTNTTPLILRSEELSLKRFFSSFDKFSIFGVDCTFKFNNNYFYKTFYPSFSSINIEIMHPNQPGENVNNLSNLNSTLDGSFFSHLSECESNFATKLKNSAFFYEDLAMHLRPLFCDRACEFLKSHELENLSIAEIGENSWFSVLWTPEKNKNNSHQEANSPFIIFYRIKPAAFDGKVGFLPVIGLFSGKIADEIFWFSNQASVQFLVNKGNLQKMKEDCYNNRIAFLQLMDNTEKFIGKNKFSLISDLNILSRN